MAEIPLAGSRWRRGKAHGTVEKAWQENGRWLVRIALDHGTEARMDAAEFLKQFRAVSPPEIVPLPPLGAVSGEPGG